MSEAWSPSNLTASTVPGPEPPLELEITWARAVRVWWALMWRSLLAMPLGAAVGCFVGAVMGFIGHLLGLPQQDVLFFIRIVTAPLGLGLGSLVGLWATWTVLRKRYSEFRIALVPVER
jgi:hypothetical protein